MKKAVRKEKKTTSSVSTQLRTIDAKLDRVIDTMATKAELKAVRNEFEKKTDRIIDTIGTLATRVELTALQVEMVETKRMVFSLITSVDKLAKSVGDLLLEYAVIKMQLERNDRWIKEIAKKVGIELTP